MALAGPVIVTIRLRVPGANIPFFEICILAPEIFCISTKLVPPGPVRMTEGEKERKKQNGGLDMLVTYTQLTQMMYDLVYCRVIWKVHMFVSVNVCKNFGKK
jgi:hypothetical protein